VGLLGAFLIGGVSQAFLWRSTFEALTNVTNSQFAWVLLTFGVAWAFAEGRVRAGVAAGSMTGLGLITSYYAMQWVADGRHSALAQFSKTGGVAWTVAAVGGGALMGFFGGLASMKARERPRMKALGITTPAVIVGLGPATWILVNSAYLDVSRALPAVAVFVLVGASLVLVAARTCGLTASSQAVAIAVGTGAVALAGLLILETNGWLYPTF
jgi:hypothetical protein